MGSLIEERVLPVLAVEVDELPAERLQGADGGQLVVDEHPAATLGRDFPAEYDLAAVVRIEEGLHDRLVGAGANQIARRASTHKQVERTEHDRLAGAGLAGQHGQAGPELHLDPLDDGEIPDAEEPNHSHSPRWWRDAGEDGAGTMEAPSYHMFDRFRRSCYLHKVALFQRRAGVGMRRVRCGLLVFTCLPSFKRLA